jgi:signal peptidase I
MTGRSAVRLARHAAFLALAALWLVTLRPQWLGGPALYLVVRGDSMLPAFHDGDLVVVMAGTSYNVGEAVAYRVPAGEIGSGLIVVHRIVEVGDDSFVIRGDNNPAPDPTRPAQGDFVGRVTLSIPGLGALIALLLDPVVSAGLAAALVVMVLVARSWSGPARPQTVTGAAA